MTALCLRNSALSAALKSTVGIARRAGRVPSLSFLAGLHSFSERIGVQLGGNGTWQKRLHCGSNYLSVADPVERSVVRAESVGVETSMAGRGPMRAAPSPDRATMNGSAPSGPEKNDKAADFANYFCEWRHPSCKRTPPLQ